MGTDITAILAGSGHRNLSELRHYGVKGMRWGVRRKRGSSSGNSTKPKKKSSIKDLSDEELRRRLNRIQMERQYRALTSTRGQRAASKAAKISGEIALNVGKQVVSAQLAKYANLGVNELLKAAGAK